MVSAALRATNVEKNKTGGLTEKPSRDGAGSSGTAVASGATSGAVYSRITPLVAAEKPAGEWQTMDITFVNRHITVILNGTKIIDNQPVAGCTGGALWSDVSRPGPNLSARGPYERRVSQPRVAAGRQVEPRG